MYQDPSAERSLPAHGAFVVQFSTETDVACGQFVGRIEHVVSGQATHFCTLDACLAFVGRVLAHVREPPSEDVASRSEGGKSAATAAIHALDLPASEAEGATS